MRLQHSVDVEIFIEKANFRWGLRTKRSEKYFQWDPYIFPSIICGNKKVVSQIFFSHYSRILNDNVHASENDVLHNFYMKSIKTTNQDTSILNTILRVWERLCGLSRSQSCKLLMNLEAWHYDTCTPDSDLSVIALLLQLKELSFSCWRAHCKDFLQSTMSLGTVTAEFFSNQVYSSSKHCSAEIWIRIQDKFEFVETSFLPCSTLFTENLNP